jgi:hypothetical protein
MMHNWFYFREWHHSPWCWDSPWFISSWDYFNSGQNLCWGKIFIELYVFLMKDCISTIIFTSMCTFFLLCTWLVINQFSIQCLSIVLQAEKVFNQDLYYKRTVKYVGEPMTHLESIASSAVRSICFSYFNLCLMFAWETFFCLSMSYHNHELSWHWFFCLNYHKLLFQVRAAIKVKASVIICFTSSGRAARYIQMNIACTGL